MPSREMSAVSPSTTPMLKILLPTTLPTARSRSPRRTAMMDVASSGSDVPTATTVSPTTRLLTPNVVAMFTAPSTSSVAPATSDATPSSTKKSDLLTEAPSAAPSSSAGSTVAESPVPSRAFTAVLASRRLITTDIMVWTTTPKNSISPSTALILPSRDTRSSRTDKTTIRGRSKRISLRFTARGTTSADSPRMSRTLMMLLPTALPTASPGSSRSTAPTLTANSGADVTADTTVRPITNDEIPKRPASADAPRTKNSPPKTSSTSPATIRPISSASMSRSVRTTVQALPRAPADLEISLGCGLDGWAS
ncbi:hypothetical protein BW35_00342 [Micrococcus luteus]|nr:hypothetical protein BW35_00342 [Micrococcus luteus]